jgi:hypothetical protein
MTILCSPPSTHTVVYSVNYRQLRGRRCRKAHAPTRVQRAAYSYSHPTMSPSVVWRRQTALPMGVLLTTTRSKALRLCRRRWPCQHQISWSPLQALTTARIHRSTRARATVCSSHHSDSKATVTADATSSRPYTDNTTALGYDRASCSFHYSIYFLR